MLSKRTFAEAARKSFVLFIAAALVSPHLGPVQAASAGIPGRQAWQAPPSSPEFQPGKLIVKFKSLPAGFGTTKSGQFSTGFAGVDALNRAYGCTRAEKLFKNATAGTRKFSQKKGAMVEVPDLSTVYTLTFPDSADIPALAARYASDPNVVYAEPNYRRYPRFTPNDPMFRAQWGLHNSGQTGGTAACDIRACEGWELARGATTVTVAVVDTGVDYTHGDLRLNMWENTDEIPYNGIDDDDNGYIDDVRGWDCSDGDNDPMDDSPTYDRGHGTHCAGVIGAGMNNNIGIAGLVPNVRIMPLKVAPSWRDDVLAEGLKYAADNGADVISNSWGGPGNSEAINEVIYYALNMGVIVVFAAGNDNTDDPDMGYPASLSGVIAVAATDHNDQKASFSNYGDWITVSAPGVRIMSTVPDGRYEEMNGTSMACPLVAGLAGLLKSIAPDAKTDEIIKAVIETVDNIDELNEEAYRGKLGAGRINAYKAIVALAETDPPKASITTSPAAPLKSGRVTVNLEIHDASAILKTPRLAFLPPDGEVNHITLTGSDKHWTGTAFIDSTMKDGTARFFFEGEDVFKNVGSEIISGGTIVIDKTVADAEGGTISNRDGTQVVFPAGAAGENFTAVIEAPLTTSQSVRRAQEFLDRDPSLKLIGSVNGGAYREITARSRASGNEISSFAHPLTISLAYPDENQDGIVDNTLVKETELKLYWFNEAEDRWVDMQGTVDTVNNMVVTASSHLSLFALMTWSPAVNTILKAYPNPCRLPEDGYVRVGPIPADIGSVEISVYNIAGERVRVLRESDPQEIGAHQEFRTARWDGRNDDGGKVASGVYFLLVRSNGKKIKTERVALFW